MDVQLKEEHVVPIPVDNEGNKGLSTLISGKEPLGFIWLSNNYLCPFGILPPGTEADALGDPLHWKEVKVTPPTWLWNIKPDQTSILCPVEFCKDRIGKNKSFDAHLKKHLGLIISHTSYKRLHGSSEVPSTVPINFYCNVKNCNYEFSVCEGSRYFTTIKYLKQHYFKVHAPKTFECQSCKKTFATVGFLDVHTRMCGKSFQCSDCSSQYTTLEALQTHARRKDHSFDYEKYREILTISRQETQAKRAESLKKKLAAISLNWDPSLKSKKAVEQLPIRIPRPKTVTTCGPGGPTSHITWTYEGTKCPKLKIEMSTQTISDSECQEVEINAPINQSTKVRSSSSNSHHGKRKKSAQTQTAKFRYKISTETQTANVVKRRRASKKQNSEAETQCALYEGPSSPLVSSNNVNIANQLVKTDSTVETTDFSSPFTEPVNNSNILHLDSTIPMKNPYFDLFSSYFVEMDTTVHNSSSSELIDPNSELDTGDALDFQTLLSRYDNTNVGEAGVSTSEMCVGNRFDEIAQELFDFEEFNQETQTDSNLFFQSDDWPLTDLTQELEAGGDRICQLLQLATAQTQTRAGVSPPPPGELGGTFTRTTWPQVGFHEGLGDLCNNPTWNVLTPLQTSTLSQTQTGHSPFDISLSPREGVSPNSPNFLETMDNETQTHSSAEGNDFDNWLRSMMNTHQ